MGSVSAQVANVQHMGPNPTTGCYRVLAGAAGGVFVLHVGLSR